MNFIIGLLVITGLIALLTPVPRTALSKWQQFFDLLQFSGADFYARVEQELQKREIPSSIIKHEQEAQTSIVSARRDYLTVVRGDYTMKICAATFGKGMFVSCYLLEADEFFINRIPVISWLIGRNRKSKTTYQLDSEASFRMAVNIVVKDVLDEFLRANGTSRLSPAQVQALIS